MSSTTYKPRASLYNPKYSDSHGNNSLAPTMGRYNRTPGKLADNYIYIYHLPNESGNGLG